MGQPNQDQPSSDQLFIRKLIAEHEALWKAEDIGVQREYLLDEAREAWDWIEKYKRENNELPGDQLIVYEMEWPQVSLDDIDVSLEYLADTIIRREVDARIRHVLDKTHQELNRGKDAIYEAQRMLIDLVDDDIRGIGERKRQAVDLFGMYPQVLSRYDRIKVGAVGVETPWETMSHAIRGFQVGDVFYIVARPETGKTFVLLYLCNWLHEKGLRVLFLSPELNRVQVATRHVCIKCGISYDAYTKGELDSFSEEELREKVEEHKDKKRFWVYDNKMKIDRSQVEHLIDRYDPDVIAFDTVPHFGEGNRRGHKIESASPWIARMSERGRDRLVLAVAQMNRNASTPEKVVEENIYGSDSILQDADTIYGIYQDKQMEDDGIMGFKQLKARRGKNHMPFYAKWDFNTMDFSEIEGQEYERD